jgi:hypothetical protein
MLGRRFPHPRTQHIASVRNDQFAYAIHLRNCIQMRYQGGGDSILKYFICILLLLTAAAPTQAMQEEETGSFQGTIIDPDGAVVPGASITVKNTGSGVERKYTTNNMGSFHAPGLPPGYFEITIEKEGFAMAVLKYLRLDNSAHRLNVKLELAPCSRFGGGHYRILAENIIIKYQPFRNSAITLDQISKLPLAYSNVLDLVKIMGGDAILENPIFGSYNPIFEEPKFDSFISRCIDGVTVNRTHWVNAKQEPYLNPNTKVLTTK